MRSHTKNLKKQRNFPLSFWCPFYITRQLYFFYIFLYTSKYTISFVFYPFLLLFLADNFVFLVTSTSLFILHICRESFFSTEERKARSETPPSHPLEESYSHRVHRVATAAFWRTFSHEGKIGPVW